VVASTVTVLRIVLIESAVMISVDVENIWRVVVEVGMTVVTGAAQ
jgi:hypothetical protein